MTWYEKSRNGHRARFPVPGKPTPAAGPVFPTREAAKEWAVRNGHDRPDIVTLRKLVERWRDVKRAEKRVMPSYLLEVEEDLMGLATARSWVNYQDITIAELHKWKIEKNGVGTARLLSYLLAVLRWGWREYGLPVDPMVIRHKTPQAPRKVVAELLLSNEQVNRLCDRAMGISPGVAALVHYLATYGPRPITACTRLISDVDFTEKTLLVDGKRSGQWRHALHDDTMKLFAATAKGRGPNEPLFMDPRTAAINLRSRMPDVGTGSGWTITRKHEAVALAGWYARTLGKPVCGETLKGIYRLKDYAITGMLQRGVDAATIAKFTGHLTVAQVLVYARGNETTTRKALEKVCVVTPHTPHTLLPDEKVLSADG